MSKFRSVQSKLKSVEICLLLLILFICDCCSSASAAFYYVELVVTKNVSLVQWFPTSGSEPSKVWDIMSEGKRKKVPVHEVVLMFWSFILCFFEILNDLTSLGQHSYLNEPMRTLEEIFIWWKSDCTRHWFYSNRSKATKTGNQWFILWKSVLFFIFLIY